jgi:type II secretory pathway component GspD/PulD (secretin)
MKPTSYYYLLIIGLTCLLNAGAQTDSTGFATTPDTNTVAPPPAAEAAPAGDTAAQAAARATLQQKIQDLGDQQTNASDTNASAMSMPDTNAIAASAADTNADDEAAATNPAPEVAIPVIRFTDVNLTAAIEALARQANINYMLDPKIGFGQPDATGVVKAEPVLSIRWENITAENALLALLDNYGLQMIFDKHTGIDRITMKDPTAPPPLFTKIIQLKYAGVATMGEAAQSVLTDKRSKVLSDVRTSQLVVVATDPEQQAVETLVEQLDKPTRQVLIETRLIQITSTPQTQKGVDWSGTLQNQQITFGNGNTAGSFTTTFPGTPGTDGAGAPTSNPYSTTTTSPGLLSTIGGGGFSWNTKSGATPDIGFLNASGLSAVLSFLNTSADAQVMSTPRIVTLDNEEADLSVTRGYPVFNVQAGTQNTAGGSSVSYTNVGTIIHVTPRISANDYIWLKVVPEVSSFAGNVSQTVSGGSATGGPLTLTAPTFYFRKLETQVLIPNANTLVMGGLVQDNPSASYTKVPLLGDIPGLGALFRSEDKSMDKDNLLIFITPTIVKDSDFQASDSGDFLKSKPESIVEPMNPKSAWDSYKAPGDTWTDPVPPTAQ